VHSADRRRLDLYTWLYHRFSYLRQPQLVPWSLLSMQFGSDYRELRNFTTALLRQLPAVMAVYPAAKVAVLDDGLLLRPSPTPVPRRKQLRPHGRRTKLTE